MAASPPFKVYRAGEYVASCKYAEDAAAIAGMGGERVLVKYHHKQVLYDHDADGQVASNSWDEAGELIRARLRGSHG